LTPLFASLLDLPSGADYLTTFELLKKYGPLLLKLRLAVALEEDAPMLATHMNLLSAFLKRIPNVVSLTLAFEPVELDLFDMYFNYEGGCAPLAGGSPLFQLLPLKALSELNIEVLENPDDENLFIAPPGSFLLPVFRAYGPQLSKLTCHRFVFEDGEDYDKNGRNKRLNNLYLTNLWDLTIINANVEDGMDKTIRTLAQLKFPKLERLAFSRQENNGIRILLHEDAKCQLGNNDKELLTLLGRFSDTLEEVRLYKLYAQELDVQDIKVLPKVKGLTVCVDNLENPSIWKRFQTQFPNLEWIRLEPISKTELLATSVMSDDEDDDEDDEEELEGKSLDSDEELRQRNWSMLLLRLLRMLK